jgi:phosphomannomutase
MQEIILHNPFSPTNPPEIFICDLDGTLAASKQAIDKEMAELLCGLMTNGKILAVISGGGFPQFEKQFLMGMNSCPPDTYHNLFLLPTSGAMMYGWNNNTQDWRQIYAEILSKKERADIISAIESLDREKFHIPTINDAYGEQIEDRISQVTLSAWGQQAPSVIKSEWDRDHTKRRAIIEDLSLQFPSLEIHSGGTNSIDITKPNINKAYGVTRFLKETGRSINTALFIGDALYRGGNDAAALITGIAAHKVIDEKDTFTYLQTFL